jgi:two-component system NtrC family sensor kinase
VLPGQGHPSLCLSVEDPGVGLPPLAPGRLLHPGFTTGKAGGTGEGLATVVEILRREGGSLLIQRKATGSRFEVWAPVFPRPGGPPDRSEKIS